MQRPSPIKGVYEDQFWNYVNNDELLSHSLLIFPTGNLQTNNYSKLVQVDTKIDHSSYTFANAIYHELVILWGVKAR
ncbi:hypothetical protein J2Y03_001060 [Neobacillus niacini]|nr:hypothetical protein [Neobacillus niacini]MDR7076057.1 hypothetical protein [Neobacillus niacini]